MPVVTAGLLLGALSGATTFGMTLDAPLSAIAAGAATALTWVGCAFLAFTERSS
ncbi:hypothetical protein [Streptomyces sp. NPDC094468]|uniref:hypothetical protein n=1 Tax=Streptomyces sp. NPDC094468 TaxID=3366066 RepID=UPI00382FFA1A